MFFFKLYSLHITDKCNLRCRYCYVKKQNKTMSWITAKSAIDLINFDSSLVKIENLGIFGGEPLLEWDLIEKIIKYSQTKYNIKKFDIATNGLLITKEILEYFVKYNVVPAISVDGIQLSQDANRVFVNGGGSFHILDKKLNLISKYLYLLPKLEIIITFTPQTVVYLSNSISYLIDKGFIKNTRYNLRPAIQSKIKWSKNDYQQFESQIFKIAEIFIKNFQKRQLLNFCANEDLPLDFYFLNLPKIGDNSYCGLGKETLGVSIEGKVYPCYVFAGIQNPLKEKFILGDVRSDSLRKILIRIKKLYNKKQKNKCQSCLYWNWHFNKNLYQPLEVYRQLYQSWLKASKYVNNALKK